MRIPLTGSGEPRRRFQHKGPVSQYLDDPAVFNGEIFILAEIYPEGGMLHLDLTAELPGQFVCDRCGQPFQRNHRGSDVYYYSYAESSGAHKDPEILVVPKGATEIDISQEIRDLIILSIPTQIFCSPDCKGLCPRCGANLNAETCRCTKEEIDSRWEALKSLRREKP